MTLKRANIFVSGNVQKAGFRTFVKNLADSLGIKGYAENLPDGKVKIVCEGEEESIAEMVGSIKTEASALSKVEDLQIKYGEYIGEYLDFERRGGDVPKKATLDDLLNVMISFDNKAEKIVDVLGDIKEDTSQIRQDTAQIRQDTSQIRQDAAQIRQDTSQISNIAENTSLIPAINEDTSEIKNNTREIADKLQNKYEELSREIAQMKVTLSKIEAKVFS